MQAGDFDNAMKTIGTAMGILTSQLTDSSDAVHPALAPLYYLYGTTLLYTIEESTDNLQSPDQGGDGDDDADDTQIAIIDISLWCRRHHGVVSTTNNTRYMNLMRCVWGCH